MKITKEVLKNFKYAFVFPFTLETLNVCRAVRDSYGGASFKWTSRAWRFNNLGIAIDLSTIIKEIVIDEETKKDLVLWKYKEEKDRLQKEKAQKLKKATDTNFVVNNVKGELRPYQKIGVEFFINNNGKAILADDMGCIYGHALISLIKNKKETTQRLGDLYLDFNNFKKDTYTLSLNKENQLVPNKIKKVIDKGERDIVTFVAVDKEDNEEYTLVLTPDHKLLTSDKKWTRIRDIPIRGEILVKKENSTVATATIIRKEKSGHCNVYDIVMEDPCRNFVANNIIVHNSGKTAQSLAYIAHSKKKKTLVVCPASVKYSWSSETEKWTKLHPYVIDSKTKSIVNVYDDYDIFIINYDLLRKFFKQLAPLRFDACILDEHHYIKNTTAKRTKMAMAIAGNTPSVLLLSGTPMLNRPIELFTGLHLMDPDAWSDWFSFSVKYAGGHRTRWGWESNGATNIEELKEKISQYFLRRTKKQILPELPPKQFVDFPVELEKESAKNYKAAETSFIKYLKEVKKKKITKNTQASKLVMLNELRQITSNGKVWAAKEVIQDSIDSGQKILVFSVYNKPLEDLYEHFGKESSVIITGKTDTVERKDIIERFQEDDNTKIFFGGMKSAGAGITLTAASVVLFIDFSWTPSDHNQAADRCHRLGQTAENITIYQLFSKGTIDEDIKDILKNKQILIDDIIDGKVEDEKSTVGVVDGLLKTFEKK